ncbi:MAG: FkbM family methyltransferase, partial [Pedobacter sp.]
MNAFKRTFGFIHQHPLAKYHLLKAYFRFFSWQIKCRLNPNLQAVKFIDKTYFLAKKGLTGITGNIYTGLHEFDDMGFLLHFLRTEDTFYDVGANVGSYTLLASGACHAQTIAFEPVPTTYAILKENIDLNTLSYLVTLANKGVGSKNDKLYFTTDEDTTNHIVLDTQNNQQTISVPITTLDSYYPKYKPTLIKIDVEGFETEVLNGANQTLADLTLKAIIIELNGSSGRYGYDDNNIHKKLVINGFKPYNYNPLKREIEELESFGNYNTIYLRDLEFIT